MKEFFSFRRGGNHRILCSFFLSGQETGAKGKLKSWKFFIKNYTIHLHHWFLFSIILTILWILNLKNSFIFGLLTGAIIEGLTYKDFYKIIYKNPRS